MTKESGMTGHQTSDLQVTSPMLQPLHHQPHSKTSMTLMCMTESAQINNRMTGPG